MASICLGLNVLSISGSVFAYSCASPLYVWDSADTKDMFSTKFLWNPIPHDLCWLGDDI